MGSWLRYDLLIAFTPTNPESNPTRSLMRAMIEIPQTIEKYSLRYCAQFSSIQKSRNDAARGCVIRQACTGMLYIDLDFVLLDIH